MLASSPVRASISTSSSLSPPLLAVVGPAAAASYLSVSAAGQGSGRSDAALCSRVQPSLQRLYSRLRAAGQAEAECGGRAVAFATNSATGVGWQGDEADCT